MNLANIPPVPFLPVFQQAFSCGLVQAYHYSGTGPGDALATAALYAANFDNTESATGKTISVLGQVPSYAMATLSQCEVNALRIATLTQAAPPNVFGGSRNPLALDFNPNGVKEYEELINQTAFYGRDGLQDIGGWPNITIALRPERGYRYVAWSFTGPAYPIPCCTIINTGPLTELFQTIQLMAKDSKSLNAVFVNAGTTTSLGGAKTENGANIMADLQSAQNVFMFSKMYGFPIVYCPPKLAEEIGLLFSTKEQPEMLRAVNNSVTNQLAALTEKMPHLEAQEFSNASYPVPEVLTAEAFLDPDLFTVKKVSASIGPNGELQINPNAPDEDKTVYVLDVPSEKRELFYQKLIKRYKNFDPGRESPQTQSSDLTLKVLLGIFGAVLGAGIVACTTAAILKSRRKGYNTV